MKNTEDNRGNIELYNPMTTRMNNDPNVTKKTRIQTSPKGTIAKIGIGNDSLFLLLSPLSYSPNQFASEVHLDATTASLFGVVV
mmetsp:Transcript_6391/g.8554  ORF Transcript_6391/g.8554 Transcript_6391/m.8554 type:complete len:84 (-) Transcript_6391:4675-4926(-)